MSSDFSELFAKQKIPLKDIESATNSFSDANLIGENAMSKAYKGKLSRSEQQIDIVAERLLGKDKDKQAILHHEFPMLCTLKHENLVSVVGFCDEKEENIIIYKHEANESLSKHLRDPSLTWMQRLKICVGIAHALSYIHYDKGRNFSLIHLNIKSSQIFLDVNWNPKLSGFKIFKMITEARKSRVHLASFNGTKGYIDPSYEGSMMVSHKTDVYSLGVVLFEVLCGRKAYIPGWRSPHMAKQAWKEESLDSPDQMSENSTQESMNSSWKSDDTIKHMRHRPPSFQQQLSYGALQDLMPPSYIEHPVRPPSYNEFKMGKPRSIEFSMGKPRSYVEFVDDEHTMERQEEELLAPLAISHYDDGTLDHIIDQDLWKQMNKDSFKIFSETAYNCLKEERGERPHIDQIIKRLEIALDLQRKHENSLIIKEKSEVPAEVEGASTNHLKWQGMKHLMIGIADIEEATQKFTRNKIGEGGFGHVYKAKLKHFDSKESSPIEGMNSSDPPKPFSIVKIKNLSELPKISSTVAVKVLSDKVKPTEADKSFCAEIRTLTSCKHDNIVSLLGFCDEDSKMILVYEYVPNRSLDDNLRSKDNMINLKWAMRLQICLDIAQGLNYLHTEKGIIHRDIKSANVLLDHNWRAKIADFGLSKIIPKSHVESYFHTRLAGTDVYVDPEYKDKKILRTASDIYSLGVVLFEIVTGTLAYDIRYTDVNGKGLAHVARQKFKQGTLISMLDPILKEEIDEKNYTLSKGPNQGSLNTFLNIAHNCLAETQADRPHIGYVISKIKDAMNLQEKHKDNLKISLKDIKFATNDFSDNNLIGRGGSARVYRGEVTLANKCRTVAVKRLNSDDKNEFMVELEILQDYKHESVIGLVGFCYEKPENIIVYEYASRGSLDMHLKDYDLTWTKRLQISIDIAMGLHFLHGSGGDTQEVVMHRDIKSPSILLTDDWKAKICDFGLSLISPKNNVMDFDKDTTCGTINYRDPLYSKLGYLTEHSDIYSFGMVLIEILCGRLVHEDNNFQILVLTDDLYKSYYENGRIDEIVFGGIKEQTVPESLITFQKLAYECLSHEREKRPTTHEVLLRLKKALEFQKDYEIWKPKLPKDYEEIFKMSNSCDVYSTQRKEDLYNMLCKGIILQHDKLWFSVGNNGERTEMISARNFMYNNRGSRKWRSVPVSRFHKAAEMLDMKNLKIQIMIRPRLLSPRVRYGVYLVFKFCGPIKSKAKRMYVNLKYKEGDETSHTYFATWREDGWMMIELCRFLYQNYDIDFQFLLESFSQCYCESRAIYVEGIEFRPIDNVKREEVKESKEAQHSKSDLNMDQVQQSPTNCEKESVNTFQNYDKGEKFSPNEVKEKKHYMLSAKEALYQSSDVKPFKSIPSTQSRFEEVIELQSQDVFRVKCKIRSQRLSPDTEYACYLVFKLSEKCHGLHFPVIVRDLPHRKNKDTRILYFRSPSPSNVIAADRVPEKRKDGWMEVNVRQFNSNKELRDDYVSINLKLISYEGTMSGLIVSSIEFRPM